MTFDPMSVEVTCDSTQGSLCPSPMTIHQCMWIQWSILQNTTYILRTTYYVHTTYRMSDHIVSYWTQFRRDKNWLYSMCSIRLKTALKTAPHYFKILALAHHLKLKCSPKSFHCSCSSSSLYDRLLFQSLLSPAGVWHLDGTTITALLLHMFIHEY